MPANLEAVLRQQDASYLQLRPQEEKKVRWGNIWQLQYTVPKAAHISEKYLGVYMGESPLAGVRRRFKPSPFRKFPKTFNPPAFGNFRKIQR
jgi:hypothetical protein